MAAKKGVLVGIAAIAVIGVAAVVYFSQWPPSGEDATGAIGAAERYRAEQITDADVELAGESTGDAAAAFSVTGQELAGLLGKASVQEKASYFERADLDQRASMLAHASMEERAAALRSARQSRDS